MADTVAFTPEFRIKDIPDEYDPIVRQALINLLLSGTRIVSDGEDITDSALEGARVVIEEGRWVARTPLERIQFEKDWDRRYEERNSG
jgi:hypothetical protein